MGTMSVVLLKYVEGSIAASFAKADELCRPLSLQGGHMFSHMAQQTRKGITASCKVSHALCKGRLHCWMIMNPQGICYHLNISKVHAEHVIAVLRKARSRMLSAAGFTRE